MQSAKLKFSDGHLFATISGQDWLIDTGAPNSFGKINPITIQGRSFSIPESCMGLNALTLSEFVKHPTAGIIGADILNEFDTLIDIPRGQVLFAVDSMKLDGVNIPIEQFMGIPVIEARISDKVRRMFFDTGAQVSYFQDESLATFPSAGSVTDFYPGYGQFQTETYKVDVSLGSVNHVLRCGVLPETLGMTLLMANTVGIIGNELIIERPIGLFPRRQQMVLA